MDPYLKGSKVIVEDRSLASTLMNKGGFGVPTKGGGSTLDLLEASYLLERERIVLKCDHGAEKPDLSYLLRKGLCRDRSFLERYLVYRDLRERGLMVRSDKKKGFQVYPRGSSLSSSSPDTWINVRRESDVETVQGLWTWARSRRNMKMNALGAVVDSDRDITYYSAKTAFEEGPDQDEMSDLDPNINVGKADKLEDGGCLIRDPPEHLLNGQGLFGSRLSDMLILSPEETEHLEKGKGPGSVGSPDDLRSLVYSDLRTRGWQVRTGFKYGSHFRVYTDGEAKEHSSLLVHCMEHDIPMTWEGLSRAIRLSHSVRKRMLYATVPVGITRPHYSGEGPVYLELSWVRP